MYYTTWMVTQLSSKAAESKGRGCYSKCGNAKKVVTLADDEIIKRNFSKHFWSTNANQPSTNIIKEKMNCVFSMRFLPRQAKPAAEEANPAAVGKLLKDAICRWSFSQSFFSILRPFSLSSKSLARRRISRRQFWYLLPDREISYIKRQNK